MVPRYCKELREAFKTGTIDYSIHRKWSGPWQVWQHAQWQQPQYGGKKSSKFTTCLEPVHCCMQSTSNIREYSKLYIIRRIYSKLQYYTCMSITYTESMYFLPDQYPCPCMQSGLQFVIGLIYFLHCQTQVIGDFHTDLLFAVFVLHKWQKLCEEDLMYTEQDIVVVMK